eukprot:TRINITY_DN14267_c0_g1_i1.p2 TRINITY_DN14267_c0_g1~~TRINITY_DN14267_c0_g1_i1.p2  ORF type:complete len:141 (-),score=33.57 TRINITY_DN14267_c0_g1_i1:95-517(-)
MCRMQGLRTPRACFDPRNPVTQTHLLLKQRQNFLTQHLVPGFRAKNPGKCSNLVLQRAKRVIDRFDLVLNLVDLPALSSIVVEYHLNISSYLDNTAIDTQDLATFRIGTNHSDARSEDQRRERREFNKTNQCDFLSLIHI